MASYQGCVRGYARRGAWRAGSKESGIHAYIGATPGSMSQDWVHVGVSIVPSPQGNIFRLTAHKGYPTSSFFSNSPRIIQELPLELIVNKEMFEDVEPRVVA